MALLTYARDTESGSPLFAVIAQDDGADYLWPDGSDPWFDDDRLDDLTRVAGTPADAGEWLALATYNIGQDVQFDKPVEMEFDDAVDAAEEALETFTPASPNQDVLSRTSVAFDQVSQDYPGFMEDDDSTTPEAMENFVLMALGPIDPDGPNGWILRAQDGAPVEGDEDAYVSFGQPAADTEAPE